MVINSILTKAEKSLLGGSLEYKCVPSSQLRLSWKRKKKERKEIFHVFFIDKRLLGVWPRIKRAMQIYVERVKCRLGRGSLPICISTRLLSDARTTRLRYRSRYRILFRIIEEKRERERERRDKEERNKEKNYRHRDLLLLLDPRRLFFSNKKTGYLETILLLYEIYLEENCTYII